MSKKNVLIIDQNTDIQLFLKHYLENEFEANCFTTLFDEFQVLFLQIKFELIICDELGSSKNRKLFFDFLDCQRFSGHIIIFTTYSKNELTCMGDTGNLEVVYEKRHSELMSLLRSDDILYSKNR